MSPQCFTSTSATRGPCIVYTLNAPFRDLNKQFCNDPQPNPTLRSGAHKWSPRHQHMLRWQNSRLMSLLNIPFPRWLIGRLRTTCDALKQPMHPYSAHCGPCFVCCGKAGVQHGDISMPTTGL
uniref:Uncharacterized protein n=1 Tax=Eutreptiella gymnastica TaxID=73025 RepID=A0A6U8K0W7_9EUGL